MSVFDVIFNRVEKFSSDANVDTQPDGKSTVVGPVHQADIARVEADSPEDAEAAVRVAYNASTSEVHVHEAPKVVDEPEPTEPASGTVTGQRTANDPPVTDEVAAQADEPGDVPVAVEPAEDEVPAEAEPTESEVAVEPAEDKPEVAVETTEPAEVA